MLENTGICEWWARQGLNLRPHPCEGFFAIRNAGVASTGARTEHESMANSGEFSDHSLTTRVSIPGFEGFYEVSSDGRVYSLAREIPCLRGGVRFVTRVAERQLKPSIDRYGYEVVTLHKGGKPWRAGLHRVVCLAFHGQPRCEGMHAAHIDGNKRNNAPDNIRWATVAENNEDRRRHGVHPMGNALPHAKLDPQKVREIVRRCKAGESQNAIARELGVSGVAISKIMLGKSWRQVTGFSPHPDILAEIERLKGGQDD